MEGQPGIYPSITDVDCKCPCSKGFLSGANRKSDELKEELMAIWLRHMYLASGGL